MDSFLRSCELNRNFLLENFKLDHRFINGARGRDDELPGHSPVVQTLLSPELHHETLLQVFGPHLHYLPIWLLQQHTHTTLIHTYNIYKWSDTCVYLGDVVISFSWFFYNLFISLLPGCTHLKDLLSGHLYTTVSRLWLLQWQLVPEQLQLMDQVSLVACCHVSISSTAAAYSATSSILAPHLHLGGLGGFLCLGLLAGSVEKQKKSVGGGGETRWREEEKGWKKDRKKH